MPTRTLRSWWLGNMIMDWDWLLRITIVVVSMMTIPPMMFVLFVGLGIHLILDFMTTPVWLISWGVPVFLLSYYLLELNKEEQRTALTNALIEKAREKYERNS